MNPKPTKTAADYMAIAFCPALIMLLVGSLVFFLLKISYAGEWGGRLQWTLFWFIFAMVLVSRLAIQQSTGAAFVYGLMLAGATWLLLNFYLGSVWGVWLILALIWWASNRIVRDCTLIDDDEDASGQGLLQVSRLPGRAAHSTPQVRAVAAGEPSLQARAAVEAKSRGLPLPAAPRIRKAPKPAPARRTPHSPGLWVLYFSFAAVPVFGLGELLIAPRDISGRLYGFGLLLVYVVAGFGLLLLTSFLGLRRYLRQRRLMMPGEVARQWVTTGLTLALAVLCLCLLLPRPATPYSASAWFTRLGSPPQRASRLAPSTRQGAEGKSSGHALSDAVPEGGQGTSERAIGPSPAAQSVGQPGGQSGGRTSTGPATRLPGVGLSAAKVVVYVVAIVIGFVVLYRLWPEIRLWLTSLSAFWRGWFRGKPRIRRRKPGQPRAAEEESPDLLRNPFTTGQADRMSPAELVRYSFDGLLRWAEARGFRADSTETPLEAGERLAGSERALMHEVLLLSGYYSGVVYGGQDPPAESLDVLRSLWTVIGFAPSKNVELVSGEGVTGHGHLSP